MKACKVMFVVFAMLLLAVPIVAAQEGWAGCPSGAAYDPMAHGYEPACFSQPAENSAALKPAGLAAPAPAVIQIQDGPVCAPGYYYYIVGPGDQGDCFPESIWTASATATAAASKSAGLAAPAPVVALEQGSRCVTYAGPNYSVCVVASSGASAAAKPAGLAAPAPVEKFVPCGFGERLDPLALACQH